jgi:hypothetical protein
VWSEEVEALQAASFYSKSDRDKERLEGVNQGANATKDVIESGLIDSHLG